MTSTNTKSFFYQIFLIIRKEIVLIVLLTIIFIENQVAYFLIFISYVSFVKLLTKYNYLYKINITDVVFTIITENNL